MLISFESYFNNTDLKEHCIKKNTHEKASEYMKRRLDKHRGVRTTYT